MNKMFVEQMVRSNRMKIMRENMESLIEKAMSVDCGNYCLHYSELIWLAEQCKNNFINGSYILFKIGFLKGQRAEKAKQKKEGVKTNEQN